MNKKLSFLAIAFCLVALVVAPVFAGGDDEGSAIGQPDKGWFYLKNISGEVVYNGDVVYYATATTVAYGEDVRLYSGASMALVAGVVMDVSIADETIGRVQVRGYHPAVKVNTMTDTIEIGEELYAGGGWSLYGSNLTTTSTNAHFVSMEAEAANTGKHTFTHTVSTHPTVKAILNLR